MTYTRKLANILGAAALTSMLSIGMFTSSAAAAPQPVGPGGIPCAITPGLQPTNSCNLYDMSGMLPGPFSSMYEITCTNPTDDGVTICRVDTASPSTPIGR
ncbi:MAG: hypothetical protein HOQ05_07760 [Corynebacteriales bacterium]|nr:hypothetical protein [Mycobacteriales bacterium]